MSSLWHKSSGDNKKCFRSSCFIEAWNKTVFSMVSRRLIWCKTQISCFFELVVAVVKIWQFRGEEFLDREAHFIKQTARIVFRGTAALFFRNAKIVWRYYYLYVSHYSDYWEDSERRIKTFSGSRIYKPVKGVYNIARKSIDVAATAATVICAVCELSR